MPRIHLLQLGNSGPISVIPTVACVPDLAGADHLSPVSDVQLKNRRPLPVPPRASGSRTSGSPVILTMSVLIGGLALLFLGCEDRRSPSAGPASTVECQVLKGRWLRPDGDYVLEVRDVAPDGIVTAVYLNPRPIHVSKAEAVSADGETRLFIELQDVGYPGCTYTLVHDPRRDVLHGIYFQAQMQQSFEVVFVRTR